MIENILTGLVGTFVGAGVSYGILKTKVNTLNKRVNDMSNNVIYKDVFEQFERRFDDLKQSVDNLSRKIDKLIEK